MKSSHIRALAMSALLLLGGCVRVDVGDHLPTLGEQLIDLDEAKQLGALTEAEFDRLRHDLLRSLK